MMIAIGSGIRLGKGGSKYSVILPQQLILTPDTFFEELDEITGWTPTNCTVELNTTQVKSGAGSLKITANEGAGGRIEKSVDWNLSVSQGKPFDLWIYPHSDPATTIDTTGILVCNNGLWWVANLYALMAGTAINNIKINQWNRIRVYDWALTGDTTWDTNIKHIQIRLGSKAGQSAIASFDLISVGGINKKAILINFDDCFSTDYTKAYPLLKAKNMVATSYVISSAVNQAGHMTSAQLIELNNNWCIGNHTYSHPITDIYTVEEYTAQMEDCRVFLDGIGLTKGSKHIGYTGNAFGANWMTAITAWGGLTGRNWGAVFTGYDYRFPYEITSYFPTYDEDIATTKAVIDNALLYGYIPSLTFHKIVDSGAVSGETNLQFFSDLIDYIEAQGIQTLTIDEYYRLYSGPITVHHK